MTHDLRLERDFDAPPDIVFDAFVDPDAQRALYADGPEWIVESELDLRVGGTWTIVFGPSRDKLYREVSVFTEVERPSRLAYGMTSTFSDGRVARTAVDISFEASGNGTRMTLTQRDFPSGDMRDDFEGGWASILTALAGVISGESADS
jgi:uncharacterized protein YndB with AHSA1/START domain